MAASAWNLDKGLYFVYQFDVRICESHMSYNTLLDVRCGLSLHTIRNEVNRKPLEDINEENELERAIFETVKPLGMIFKKSQPRRLPPVPLPSFRVRVEKESFREGDRIDDNEEFDRASDDEERENLGYGEEGETDSEMRNNQSEALRRADYRSILKSEPKLYALSSIPQDKMNKIKSNILFTTQNIFSQKLLDMANGTTNGGDDNNSNNEVECTDVVYSNKRKAEDEGIASDPSYQVPGKHYRIENKKLKFAMNSSLDDSGIQIEMKRNNGRKISVNRRDVLNDLTLSIHEKDTPVICGIPRLASALWDKKEFPTSIKHLLVGSRVGTITRDVKALLKLLSSDFVFLSKTKESLELHRMGMGMNSCGSTPFGLRLSKAETDEITEATVNLVIDMLIGRCLDVRWTLVDRPKEDPVGYDASSWFDAYVVRDWFLMIEGYTNPNPNPKGESKDKDKSKTKSNKVKSKEKSIYTLDSEGQPFVHEDIFEGMSKKYKEICINRFLRSNEYSDGLVELWDSESQYKIRETDLKAEPLSYSTFSKSSHDIDPSCVLLNSPWTSVDLAEAEIVVKPGLSGVGRADDLFTWTKCCLYLVLLWKRIAPPLNYYKSMIYSNGDMERNENIYELLNDKEREDIKKKGHGKILCRSMRNTINKAFLKIDAVMHHSRCFASLEFKEDSKRFMIGLQTVKRALAVAHIAASERISLYIYFSLFSYLTLYIYID
jgi:hypothetical protein